MENKSNIPNKDPKDRAVRLRTAKDYVRYILYILRSSVRWIIVGIVCGGSVGIVGSVFALLISFATSLRLSHPWLLFLLPAAGIAIVFGYRHFYRGEDRGTNLVLESIRTEKDLPFTMAPMIFVSTVLTHLCGGSAGREGAALQVGGSIGYSLGNLFHVNKKDHQVFIMAGMSAAFSALFGTPLAAAVLAMEISTIGIVYESALVPCVIAAIPAYYISRGLGVTPTAFPLSSVPDVTFVRLLKVGFLAILCAAVSILFILIIHGTENMFARRMKNPYIRIIVSSLIIIAATLLLHTNIYNGAGAATIAQCMSGDTTGIYAVSFLLKILFTAVTLAGGFRGGEIVPALFTGAVFGAVMASVLGLPVSLCSAVAMGCLFCGITNCPFASILICFEMFGFDGAAYFMLAIALTYIFSGNFGIYQSQRIRFSKYEQRRIDETTL